MNSPPVFTLEGDRVVEFEEDVNVLSEPEQIEGPGAAALVIPSTQALAEAKRFWVRVIRRLTEPIPDQKGYCRVRDSAEPNQGRIEVHYGTGRSVRVAGNILDISDRQCVILYRTETHEGENSQVCEIAMPIPWTELVNIQFEVRRPRKLTSA